MCRQLGIVPRMAYLLHCNTILFHMSYVFRYLYHSILVLICCYILAPGFTAAQLRASFAVVQFSRQMFLSCCALSYGVLSMLQVGIGPPPSSPDQVRAGSNLWLEGKRLRQRATGWGLGQHVCRLARKASSGQRAGVRVETLYAKVSTRTGVRRQALRRTADRLLAADSPNSHPWQWRNNGSRQVVAQGLSRDGRSAKAD